MMELTGEARLFALPMLIAIIVATATSRSFEKRSIYEARLTDEEVAQRLRAREFWGQPQAAETKPSDDAENRRPFNPGGRP